MINGWASVRRDIQEGCWPRRETYDPVAKRIKNRQENRVLKGGNNNPAQEQRGIVRRKQNFYGDAGGAKKTKNNEERNFRLSSGPRGEALSANSKGKKGRGGKEGERGKRFGGQANA